LSRKLQQVRALSFRALVDTHRKYTYRNFAGIHAVVEMGALPGPMKSSYRYYVLGILTLTSMLSIADRLIMSILLEDIKAEFTMTDTQLGLLAGLAFTLFYAILGIPIARLADKWNRKNIVGIALIMWSVMTSICGAATGFISLFLARLGVGVGEAGGSPPSYSIIADYFQPHELARAMGIFTVGAVLGTGGGIMIGGFLADAIGWRLTFLALGVPGVLLGVILLISVKEPLRGRYDTKENQNRSDEVMRATLASLSRNKVFVGIGVSFALLTMVGYAMAIWMAPIMLRNFDIPVSTVGFYLGCAYFIGGIPGPILGGYLTDYLVRFDARWRAWMPAIAIVGVVIAYWFCLSATSLQGFLGFFTLAYALFMLPQAASLSLLQSSVHSGQRALAVALALLVNNLLGQALGPFLIGTASDALGPSYGEKALNYSVFSLCAVAAVLAAMSYLWTAKVMSAAGSDAERDLSAT
jgi:predicted MFS family arabinose efflux permease